MGDKIEKKEKGIKVWKCILSISFVILSVLLVYLLIWTKDIFGDVPFSQVIFHMMVPLEGTDTSIIMSYVYGASKWVGIASAIMVALGVIYYLNQKSKKDDEDSKDGLKSKKIKNLFRAAFFLLSFCSLRLLCISLRRSSTASLEVIDIPFNTFLF